MRMHEILILAVGVTLAACGETGGPSTNGTLVVSTSAAGNDPDQDGYRLTVDGVDALHLDAAGTATVDLPPGRHTLSLLGVAEQCSVAPGTSLEVDIAPRSTTPVAFEVSCPLTGAQITVTTTGLDLDPDGYQVAVDGSDRGAIPGNGTVPIRLDPGSRTFALTNLAPNCAVDGFGSQTVAIVDKEVAPVEFAVVCTATSGVIRVGLSASGFGAQTVYEAMVDGATPSPVVPDNPTYVGGVPPGDHAVSLNAPANCSVETSPQTVVVTAGSLIRDTVEATFSVICLGPTRPRIAFVRRAQPGPDGRPTPGTTLDIYIANADGSEATRLTSGESPAWSPDGRRLVFNRGNTIYVIDADLSNERVLAQGGNPAWSPDGTRIVFNTLVGDRDGGIFVMNADGSRRTRLIRNDFASPGSRNDWTGWPEWSPDGRISFVRTAGYDYEPWRIYVMNADGSDPRLLNVSPLSSEEHAWSPDGSRIVGRTGRGSIGSVASSGGDFRVHYDIRSTNATHPDWSPDGRSIVFDQLKTTVGCAPPACPRRIYIVSTGGGPARQLIPELEQAPDYWDYQPAWSRANE